MQTVLALVMRQAGWRYDIASNGFVRGSDWVSWDQAESAHAAAAFGQELVPEHGLSRLCAEAVQNATNDNAGFVPQVIWECGHAHPSRGEAVRCKRSQVPVSDADMA